MNLLNLAAYLKNVSEACRVMGYSRDTFYRVKKAYENGGMEALKEKSRRNPNIKNRVSKKVEQAVVAFALEEPAFGQKRAADTLRRAVCSSRRLECAAYMAPAWTGDVCQEATAAGEARCPDR